MAEISLLAMERFFVLLAVASATLALVIAGARFLAVGYRIGEIESRNRAPTATIEPRR